MVEDGGGGIGGASPRRAQEYHINCLCEEGDSEVWGCGVGRRGCEGVGRGCEGVGRRGCESGDASSYYALSIHTYTGD